MNVEYQPYKELKKRFHVSRSALLSWENSGYIETRKTPGGKRFYKTSDVEKLFENQGTERIGKVETIRKEETGKITILYARVSSRKQSSDLERQINRLKKVYPEGFLIKDIASSLNFHRKGFQTLLDSMFEGNIERIVITYKDRLTRFGFDLFYEFSKRFRIIIEILDKNDTQFESENREKEDVGDIIAILNYFVSKQNSGKEGENRGLENEDSDGEIETY